MDRPFELLVLGLGPAAVARLEREWSPPPGCAVLDGGTLGLALLPLVEDAGRLILIDAVRLDLPPGAAVRLEGRDIEPAVRERLSVHQVGLGDVMDALRLRDRLPEEMVLVGAVPESLGLGLGLSAAVAATLPVVIEQVLAEAERLGFPFVRRERDAVAATPHARALFGL